MRSIYNSIIPAGSQRLKALSHAHSRELNWNENISRNLILTGRSAPGVFNYLNYHLFYGVVIGVSLGLIIGFLFSAGIFYSEDLQPLFFSKEFFLLMGAKEVVASMLSGAFIGLILGSITGAISSIEIPE